MCYLRVSGESLGILFRPETYCTKSNNNLSPMTLLPSVATVTSDVWLSLEVVVGVMGKWKVMEQFIIDTYVQRK